MKATPWFSILTLLLVVLMTIMETGSMSVSRSSGANVAKKPPKKPQSNQIAVTYLSTAEINNYINKNLNCSRPPVHKLRRRQKSGNGTMCTSKALHHCSKKALPAIKKMPRKPSQTTLCPIRQEFFKCFQANDSRKPCKDRCPVNNCSNVPCFEKNPKAAKRRKNDLKKLAEFLWKSHKCPYTV